MSFKNFLDIYEETAAADIASVDAKLGSVRRASNDKHMHKGKRCKLHKIYKCELCLDAY